MVNILNASKIKLDGILTNDKGIFPKGRYEVPTPEGDIVYIDIRGRDGELTKKYGYKNIPLSVTFYIHADPFKTAFRKAKPFLLNAKLLQIDDDDEIYYKVKSVQVNPAENPMRTFGEFVVDFVLDPFQYEVENEQITITSSTAITNDGYDCLPIIEATSTGSGRIFINDNEILITNINGKIVIDSEQKNAYRPGNPPLPANNRMEGDFPVIKNGDNSVRFNGDISKLEITLNKRWR